MLENQIIQELNMKQDKLEFFKPYPMTYEAILSGASEEEYMSQLNIEIMERTLERRMRNTLKDRITKIDETGEYRLFDLVFSGDKIVITGRPNVISSSITIEYTNTDFDCGTEVLALNNCDASWKLLHNINNTFHPVYVQVWDEDGEVSSEVPFLESRPYEYRNNRGLFDKKNEFGNTI
jgi:hypothetical protein